MIITIWRVAAIVSAVLTVLGVLLLLILRPLKNKYYFSYEENELIKTEKTANSVNSIFFTSGETQKYIKKYVLCKTLYDKYLVCNYAKKFNSVSYYVVQYSSTGRVVSTLRVTETDTGDESRVIALSARCAKVNVIISSVGGAVINAQVIRPLSPGKIRLHAFLVNFVVFLGLFAARHFILECVAHDAYLRPYLMHIYNYIAVGASALLSLLGYFIEVLALRRRNIKQRSGEVLEYEFV